MEIDERIREDVEAELDYEPSLDSTAIVVEVSDGIITLTGTVPAWCDRRRAEYAAMRVMGARAVANELVVPVNGGFELSEAADLARGVIEVLKLNVLVPSASVHASICNGVVVIDGEVEWEYQRKAAEDALSCLRGVRGVVNDITVRPSVKASAVGTKVRAAFLRNATLRPAEVRIRANHGRVVLTGHVCSWGEKRLAARVAWSVPGVTWVADEIEVDY